ncbi:hypothetical protein HDU96_010964 [Phlyctochytrium bullatum]|nr:hypothetical protein HDU96_010964 [Phlyctochytrium bullatum]
MACEACGRTPHDPGCLFRSVAKDVNDMLLTTESHDPYDSSPSTTMTCCDHISPVSMALTENLNTPPGISNAMELQAAADNMHLKSPALTPASTLFLPVEKTTSPNFLALTDILGADPSMSLALTDQFFDRLQKEVTAAAQHPTTNTIDISAYNKHLKNFSDFFGLSPAPEMNSEPFGQAN